MKAVTCLVFIILLVGFTACRREEPSNPYPVWIIDVHVYELSMDPTNPLPLVQGSPVGMFHIDPSGEDTVVGLVRNSRERIHLWEHIDGTVTIQYYVRCPHYQNSDPRQVTLSADQAYQGPGRDGPEIIFVDTVRLAPQVQPE